MSTKEGGSTLKSILAKAADVMPAEPASRPRDDSQNGMKPSPHVSFPEDVSYGPSHAHTKSGLSFTGFDSFDEARRGFEVGPNCPAFWPPKDAVFRPGPTHHQYESLYNIATVDPLGYANGLSCLPSMDDDMSVDNTFSFIHRNKPRAWVDSDASSFYFRAPGGPMQIMHPYRRSHRLGPSALSIASNAPPVSLYNRSFASHGHRKNDLNTSASSVTLSYAQRDLHVAQEHVQRRRLCEPDAVGLDHGQRPVPVGRGGLAVRQDA